MLSRLKSWLGPNNRPVAFKTSTNEPKRLLSSAAACGRLADAATLVEEDEHPCRARPFPLDVDSRRLADAVRERAGRTLGYDFLYTLVAVVGGVAAAIQLEAFDEEGAVVSLGAAGLVAAAIFFKRLVEDKTRVARDHAPAAFDAARTGEDRDAPDGDRAPLVVYAGHNPFAQFGYLFGELNLVVDAARPKAEPGATRLLKRPDRAEIEARIVAALGRSGDVAGPPEPVYFAQGAALPDPLRPAPGARPPETVRAAEGWDAEGETGARVRRYLWLSRSGWSREIAISYFLRIGRLGDDLTLDLATAIMPPIAARHRWADNLPPRHARAVAADLMTALICGPAMLVVAPLRIAGWISSLFANPQKILTKQVEDDPSFDFGAPESPRRRYASLEAMGYFLNADRRAAEAAFTGRILRAFIDYLDECGVDTSELREQRSMVLNQGVIVQNGDFRAENVAAGAGASIRQGAATRPGGERARKAA